MSVDWSRPQKAESKVMDYAWGERGPEAFLDRLRGKSDEGPKAELWMGAHPKAPSVVAGKGLDQWFAERPELLGSNARSIDPSGLPYLFKLLSAARPLSIQLHPNKEEAEILHRRDPEHYPDANHKPEIAIALEEHEALLGFEGLDELLTALESYPEFCALLEKGSVEELKASRTGSDEDKKRTLKKVFTSLFKTAQAEPARLVESTASLRARISERGPTGPKETWFLELSEESSEGDVGLFCLFFLNYRRLKRGEGVFLKADVPHAYLRGNIIECMANSDNVVRAGLTPKFVDVSTLAEIVEIELQPLQVQTGEDNGLGGKVYKVPVREFEVHLWQSQKGPLEVDLSETLGPRIGVILEGGVSFEGQESFNKGEVFFLSDLCKAPMTLERGSELYLARPA